MQLGVVLVSIVSTLGAVTQAVASGETPWGLVGVIALVVVLLAIIVRIARSKLSDAEGETSDKQ